MEIAFDFGCMQFSLLPSFLSLGCLSLCSTHLEED